MFTASANEAMSHSEAQLSSQVRLSFGWDRNSTYLFILVVYPFPNYTPSRRTKLCTHTHSTQALIEP